MFERRHYNAIANTLAKSADLEGIDATAHARIVFQFSTLFEKDNPNFKPGFFFAASGLPKKGVSV